MKLGLPTTDYRKFRFSKLNSPEFRHLRLLLFWPVFGCVFYTVERLWIRDSYHSVSCALDNAIPFCEYFVIPYMFWFVFLVGIHLYTLLYDTELFKRLMEYIMITYSAAMIIYLIYPTCQDLRPVEFARDNALTRFMSGFYRFDTNTNVCPSIHVIGSLAVWACAWHSKHFGTPGWRAGFTVAAVLISVSTVFLKQHSAVDVAAALPICLVAHIFTYGLNGSPVRLGKQAHGV